MTTPVLSGIIMSGDGKADIAISAYSNGTWYDLGEIWTLTASQWVSDGSPNSYSPQSSTTLNFSSLGLSNITAVRIDFDMYMVNSGDVAYIGNWFFGNGGGVITVSTVPEPATCLGLLVPAAGALMASRRKW